MYLCSECKYMFSYKLCFIFINLDGDLVLKKKRNEHTQAARLPFNPLIIAINKINIFI